MLPLWVLIIPVLAFVFEQVDLILNKLII